MSLETITLSSPGARTEAQLVPEANMVCCSLTDRGTELLDQQGGVEAYAERGRTMGIPLLYPWANRLARFGYEAAGKAVTLPQDDPGIPRDPAGLPIHGVLPRLLRWEVIDRPDSSRVRAILRWDRPELLAVFPYAHEVWMEVGVRDGRLTVETSIRATSEDQVPVAFGFHPYLRIPAAPRDRCRLTIAASRRLVLDRRMIPTGAREPVLETEPLLGDRSWDDPFDGLAEPARFSLTSGGHLIRIELLRGYSFAQIYSPSDSEFVCVEPMTAATNALNSGDGLQLVAPGDQHRSEFAITVDVQDRPSTSARAGSSRS